ncbi:MAG: lytic murein transglycosylase B [Coxiella sp. RIFCSPHIGHO2_12_FULL_42_15]|nr:MAG: lytic murein transglycosylase B [Coxiella sp. RIFCSPHIGHO2_12_FULL_42_15]
MLLRNLLLGLFALFFLVFNVGATTETTPLPQPIQQFIKSVHQQYHFNETELTALFRQTHIDQNLIEKMNHPYEEKQWPEYRKFFITQQRIDNGNAFWRQHQSILQQAEKKYGVPAHLIVAIIGIETGYGQHIGNYPVLDTLTTLSFYYPRREQFFRHELTEYLLLTREQKLKPLQLKGSYAGAIGIPQFMPSTYRHYAVDFSNQGSADLVNDTNDAIFSIANYLSKMGWKKQQPIAAELNTSVEIDSALISDSAKPMHSIKTWQHKGVPVPTSETNLKLKAAIIKLASESPKNNDYWLTYPNFRTIMLYNPRIHYAMAVYQLSEAIKNAYQQTTITARTSAASARQTG